MLKGMKISDLEQAKKKIEIWFPRHIDQVRKELGEERAEEYVKRGESLLNGLLVTTFASIVLFSVSIPEAISFLRDLEMQLLVLFLPYVRLWILSRQPAWQRISMIFLMRSGCGGKPAL